MPMSICARAQSIKQFPSLTNDFLLELPIGKLAQPVLFTLVSICTSWYTWFYTLESLPF